jgi:hypothetical protein
MSATERFTLQIKLLSDTTPGNGEGLAGLLDAEVQHDSDTGLPFIPGRTVKGLLVESCADILYASACCSIKTLPALEEAAIKLFGNPGSHFEGKALLRVDNAVLPADFRAWIAAQVSAGAFHPQEILDLLSTVRKRTANSAESYGAPETASLRSSRCLFRDLVFHSALSIDDGMDPESKALLAACALGARRVGMTRNRGMGKVETRLLDTRGRDLTMKWFKHFATSLAGGAS